MQLEKGTTMAKLNWFWAILVLALSVTATGRLAAQSCKVEIASPQKGDSVGKQGEVRGTATVPPGMFLWIFAHREGLSKWWPQGGGTTRVKGKDGKWVVLATYGDEKDPSGTPFEIVAILVDQNGHNGIVKYVQESEAKNFYPGMDLPSVDPACVSEEIVVNKK